MRLSDSDDREIAEESYTTYRDAWTPWVLASAIQPVWKTATFRPCARCAPSS